ncbi:hypothetical protein CFC21_086035 [Triticum aestivum]|uniref:Disease resistance protein At4g27190-like leucine-rich repeats domain-containing protein n=2 Tax=Triticum aestivum TaxID=4565 RepID=A0A9R1IDP7_WHEAT|nr:hypothetical protein CFC21_086035 [Triticum aestivum]
MQREIVEQLNLPNWVTEIFDKQDEDNDFNGLYQGSQTEITQVVREIYQATHNQRFLVILHNVSNEEIDIFKFGVYIYGYANNKMLWTFHGRFHLDPKMLHNVNKSMSTNVVLSASSDQRDPHELWSYLVHHEAAQVSCNKNGHGIIEAVIAAECVLYIMKQCHIDSHIMDYDWAIHTSNYWVCDGIITLTYTDKAWQVGDVLQHKVRLLDIVGESTTISSSHLARSTKHMSYWISTPTCGFVLSPSGAIVDIMFQHYHKLSVLKLSRCTFSFSSPPFLYCHSLRFMWLEHCADLLTRTNTIDHHQRDADKEGELDNSTMTSWECFQSLWVLDLRYTDWDQILSARLLMVVATSKEKAVKNYCKSNNIQTLWASELHSARYIFDMLVKSYFKFLKFLHLDHCPRLVHVLPFSTWTHRRDAASILETCTLDYLETLEILYCSDLREVFPLSPHIQEQDKILDFPNLRRIHLHELPKLQRICGRRIFAPKLTTIKIRGCWSLRCVPAVRQNTKPPKVDCEKEWWDNLEWDGLEENHHPSLYEPTHSPYYKKAQLPRGTILRLAYME